MVIESGVTYCLYVFIIASMSMVYAFDFSVNVCIEPVRPVPDGNGQFLWVCVCTDNVASSVAAAIICSMQNILGRGLSASSMRDVACGFADYERGVEKNFFWIVLRIADTGEKGFESGFCDQCRRLTDCRQWRNRRAREAFVIESGY